MLQVLRKIGVFFLIAAWLTSCGNKPNTNNTAIRAQEKKEKEIIEEWKSFLKDEDADFVSEYITVDITTPPNTPAWVIRERLENITKSILSIEKKIKKSEAVPGLFYKNGKEMEGTKKYLELYKEARKKHELLLGITNPR